MTTQEVFPHAPIVEALLDVRVELPAEASLELLAGFQDHIERDYPTREVRKTFTGRIEVPAQGNPTASTEVANAGYLFRSKDGLRVVQARRDGFTFSRLKPYISWDDLTREAIPLWKRYATLTKANKVTRIALRYINRIDIPLPIDRLDEYLLTVPSVAPGLTQQADGFFLRLVMSDPNSQAVAVVTEAVEEQTSNAKTLAVIFDIDVFREVSLPASSTDLLKQVMPLRDFKNRVFASSLTEKCKELFR